MTQFNVGDRVRTIYDDGRVGTITDIHVVYDIRWEGWAADISTHPNYIKPYCDKCRNTGMESVLIGMAGGEPDYELEPCTLGCPIPAERTGTTTDF